MSLITGFNILACEASSLTDLLLFIISQTPKTTTIRIL